MKQEFKVYKLHFTTPVHFSDEREDYGKSLLSLHSDAMYAALLSALAKIDYPIPENGELGFTISSLFPFYQKEEKDGQAAFFFPKMLTHPTPDASLLNIHKQIKKLKWLDINYFQEQINGNELFSANFNQSDMKGSFLTAMELPSDGFIHRQVFPRVTVPRFDIIDGKRQDPTPFYMERVFFSDDSGLFFIAQASDEGNQLLEKALNVLQDEGLGTDRNVGNGFFKWSKDTVFLDLPESQYAMCLGMFLPDSDEQLQSLLTGDKSVFDFKKRGGWITTPPYGKLRKNSVYMFIEGCVFNTDTTNKPMVKGRIADLKPAVDFNPVDHSIFRNGKSIFIPVKT